MSDINFNDRINEDEWERIPEELRYRIVVWFERHAHKKMSDPYSSVHRKKLTKLWHDLMEAMEGGDD